jgi:hypothetical protein
MVHATADQRIEGTRLRVGMVGGGPDFREMAAREAARPDGVEAVVIVAFIEASVASSRNNGAWASARFV